MFHFVARGFQILCFFLIVENSCLCDNFSFIFVAKVVSVDENASNKPLGPNEEGELCFKGDLIMKGYCGDEKSTSAVIDKDGWLHTGDIGYYDSDGYFYIVDRLKELIKYKGFQVPPAELEGILLTHPEVVDAAVIGIPDERSGELPLGFVVRKPKSKVTAQEIVEFVNGEAFLSGFISFFLSTTKFRNFDRNKNSVIYDLTLQLKFLLRNGCEEA